MDEDDLVIAQIGLLLTQVHYSRIALEGIERATTRYAGIALALPGASGTGGSPWGAPPLLDGALKVYVVNIADLTAGNSLGDVIAGVMGGAGRFLGGVVGGIGGGALGGLALPWMLYEANHLTEHLDSILARLGVGQASSGDPTSAAGSTLSDQIQSLKSLVRDMTLLFQVASGDSPSAQTSTPESGGLVAALTPALALAVAATHLVDGLVLLLPLVTGALAWLLDSLGRIEVAVLDLVEFALRAALLLRAAVLGTALDTVSLLGRLAATTLGLVVSALDTIIPSVFRLVVAGLDVTLTALAVASTGIKNVVDGLLLWMRDGLGRLLVYLGNLRVFRLVEHLALIAPAVLPAIARIMDKPLTKDETAALGKAAAPAVLPFGPGTLSAVPAPAGAPDLVALALPPASRTALEDSVRRLGSAFAAETHTSLTAVQDTLGGIGSTFRGAVDGLDARLGTEIANRSQTAAADVATLTDALGRARTAARERPRTGLEAIATAYEDWLRGGGMTTLLQQIDQHFRTAPVQGAAAEASVPGRTVRAVLADERDRRVVVEIDEVVLDLGPAPLRPPGPQYAASGFDPDAYRDWQEEFTDRGGLLPA